MSILGLLILISLALGAAAWMFFVWTVRSGQYEDPEGPKYRMLEDEEPAPRDQPREERASAAAGPAGSGTPPVPAKVPEPPEPARPADPALALRTAATVEPVVPRARGPAPAPPREVPPSRRNGVHRP